MRVVFVGSKNMGVAALETLLTFQRHGTLDIVAAVARDDDDGEHWYGSVSRLARENDLELLMPADLRDEAFLQKIVGLSPDIGLCCFYPKLFRKPFFSIPTHGFINLHFGPLPRYRGALPIPHAILNGEREHGATMHVIDAGMDSGPIVSQILVPLHGDDTGFDLYSRCERAGQVLFHDTLQKIVAAGGLPPVREQDEEAVISYKRKDLKSIEVRLSWGAKRIYDFTRAFDFPGFDLPFVDTAEGRLRLSVRPDRHGRDPRQLEFLEHEGRRVYLLPES